MTPETLLSLADRVCAGDGPDMALARQVQIILGWHRVLPSQCNSKHGGYIAPEDWIGSHGDGSPILDSLHGTTIHRDVPDILTSLDAVEALRERLLPGSFVSSIRYIGHWEGELTLNRRREISHRCNATTEPRARLAAILRALAAGG